MPETPSETPKPSRGSTYLSAILSWPMFGILALILFWKPLHQLGEVIPKLAASSDTVTIGTVTLQIRQNLKTLEGQAGPEVREAMSGMEAEDALTVLENNMTGPITYSGDTGDMIPKWRKLARLGLVEEMSEKDLRKSEKENRDTPGDYTFGVRPTEKYDKVHKFLARAVFEIANASAGPELTEKAKSTRESAEKPKAR